MPFIFFPTFVLTEHFIPTQGGATYSITLVLWRLNMGADSSAEKLCKNFFISHIMVKSVDPFNRLTVLVKV